jgi:hypothetical protein
MCDISIKTRMKSVTVFKAAVEHEGEFYSLYSAKKLSVGPVKPLTVAEIKHGVTIDLYCGNQYLPSAIWQWHYNEHMVGKVSGFKLKRDAVTLAGSSSRKVVLKIVLGGEIMKGTANAISFDIPYENTTYAGTVIKSIQKI